MIFTLRFVQWLLTIGGKLSFCHVGKVSVRRVLLSSQILADMLLLHALWIKSGWHTAFTLQSCFVEGSLIVMWMWSLCYFICHWCRWVSWCWCIETGEEWPRDVSCERPVKFQQLPIICNDMKFLPLAMLNVVCWMLYVVCWMLNVVCCMLSSNSDRKSCWWSDCNWGELDVNGKSVNKELCSFEQGFLILLAAMWRWG